MMQSVGEDNSWNCGATAWTAKLKVAFNSIHSIIITATLKVKYIEIYLQWISQISGDPKIILTYQDFLRTMDCTVRTCIIFMSYDYKMAAETGGWSLEPFDEELLRKCCWYR